MNDKPQEEGLTRADAILRELAPVFDIPLHVEIEVSRTRLRVLDLMKLAPESVIQLKKPAGEPFDVCINGLAVGRGEIITLDQSSGVRIVEIQRSGSVAS
jgi:flagellar motor switch protein FliN/FliY